RRGARVPALAGRTDPARLPPGFRPGDAVAARARARRLRPAQSARGSGRRLCRACAPRAARRTTQPRLPAHRRQPRRAGARPPQRTRRCGHRRPVLAGIAGRAQAGPRRARPAAGRTPVAGVFDQRGIGGGATRGQARDTARCADVLWEGAMTMKRRNSRRLLASAVLVALAVPGMAFAQSAKEVELEARVAQLEAQIQALLQGQQQQQESITRTQAQLDQAQVAQPASKPVQSKPILANPDAVCSYGGFIKFDAMVTDTSDGAIAEGSAGRLFYVPSTIPVTANGAEPDTDPYTDMHAAFSRFWFAADHTTEGGDKFRAYIEADMYGGGTANLGNEVNTNTHGITLRQAFVSWNNWLAGQTWSNFQDVAALPEAVDFVGVTEGTTFVRQAQIRYTSGPFSVALENPHTTVSSIATAARNNAAGSDSLPDLTARYVMKGDWGHFSAAGLVRQLKSGDESQTGAAVSLSGRFNLGASDDIRWMANYGSGIGRYLGFGLGADSVL